MPTEMSLLNGRLLDSMLPPDRAASNLISPPPSPTSSHSRTPLTLTTLHKFQFKAQIKQSSNTREQVQNLNIGNDAKNAENWKWCESFTIARLPRFEHCRSTDPHNSIVIPTAPYPSISRNPVNTAITRARLQNRPHSLSRTNQKRSSAHNTHAATCSSNTTRVTPTSTIPTALPHFQATLPAPIVSEVVSGLAYFALSLLYTIALLVLARFLRVPLLGRLLTLVLQLLLFTLKLSQKGKPSQVF